MELAARSLAASGIAFALLVGDGFADSADLLRFAGAVLVGAVLLGFAAGTRVLARSAFYGAAACAAIVIVGAFGAAPASGYGAEHLTALWSVPFALGGVWAGADLRRCLGA